MKYSVCRFLAVIFLLLSCGNFALAQSDFISGDVVIPSGVPASQDWNITVEVNIYDDEGSYQSSLSTDIVIAVGASGSAYSVEIPNPQAGSYTLSYSCFLDCYNSNQFEPNGYYRADGTVVSFGRGDRLAALSSHAEVDIELIELVPLSGTLFLPEGEVALQDVEVEIGHRAERGDGLLVSNDSERFVIPAGANGVPFTIYSARIDDGGYLLDYRCRENCDGYLDQGYYSSLGTTENILEEELIDPESDIDDIAFQLIPGVQISGEISLPQGMVAIDDMRLSIVLKKADPGNPYGVFVDSNFAFASIDSGETSTLFLQKVRRMPGLQFGLGVSCYQNCDGIVQGGYYSPEGMQYTIGTAFQFDGETDYSEIQIDLVKDVSIVGEVALPSGVDADSDIDLSIIVFQLLESGQIIIHDPIVGNLDFNRDRVVIEAGATSASYRISGLPPIVGGSTRVFYSCNSSCDGFANRGYYGVPDTVLEEIDATLLDASLDQADIDLTLIKVNRVSGTLGLPGQDVATSEMAFTVEVEAFDADGNMVSSEADFPTISLGTSSQAFDVNAKIEPNGYYVVRYLCYQGCGPYPISGYYNSLGSVVSKANASQLAASNSHMDLDFRVLRGNRVSGRVSIPERMSINGEIELLVSAILYTGDGTRLGASGAEVVDFLSFWSTSSFAFNSAQLVGGYYLLRYRCLDNCGDISDAYYSASGPVLSPEDATQLSSSVSHANLNFIAYVDFDDDGVGQHVDNCPTTANADQQDFDEDGLGDACDSDMDGDGVLDIVDNCQGLSNPSQADFDDDDVGDPCDEDRDGDGQPNTEDNCPREPNPHQVDFDDDNIGDVCDDDLDGDNILNFTDNCPGVPNSDQADLDDDGEGDPCDLDQDGDGISDINDLDPRDRYICGDLDDNGCDDCARACSDELCFPVKVNPDGLAMICL